MTANLPQFGDGTARRAAHALGLGVLVLVVLIFLVAAVPQFAGADESFVVQSDSMAPSIAAGSVVLVSDVPAADIMEGDVITYQRGGDQPITHRVVEIRDDGQFVTKGDANEDSDPQPVPTDAVLGEVTFHVPLIGYVIAFAGTDLGLIMLVVIPAALLLVLEVRDILQSGEDSKEAEPES